MKKYTKAFTIIELLGAIVIVAVLITIVFPRLIASAKEARHKACRGQIAIVNEQVELYYAQVGEWPRADLMDMVWDTNRFPDGMPSCPVTGYFYWIYEDTHRVGGHDENNPDSHKELGYMTTGDYTHDSQGFLEGKLVRKYDAEGAHYRLIKYGDCKRELMEDGVTWKVVAWTEYHYNAYGSLLGQHNISGVEYELVDGEYKMMGYTNKLTNRRGQLFREVYKKLFYDNEGNTRIDYTEATHYYPFSEGLVKSKSKNDYHFDLDEGRYTGLTNTGWDAKDNKLGETVLTYDAVHTSGEFSGLLKAKTLTFKDGSEPPKVLAVHKYTDIGYREGTRDEESWDLIVDHGDGTKLGKIAYKVDYGDEGEKISQNWKFYDYNKDTGSYDFSHDRDVPAPPGIDWNVEQNKRESFERVQTVAGEYEKRGYYTEYDSYGREKFVKKSLRDENGLVVWTKEHSNYVYDETTGLLKTVKTTSKNPDGSLRRTLDVAYDNYDDAGRLTAWSWEGIGADGKMERSEKSRTYEGAGTVTGNSRKAYDLTTDPPTLKYHYEFKDIKRKVTGDYESYSWTNVLTGVSKTDPPDKPVLPW